MRHNRFPRLPAFGEHELHDMHRAALQVLHEVGLEVAHRAALRKLARPGARVEGERVYLAPSLVEEQLDSLRRLSGPGYAIE